MNTENNENQEEKKTSQQMHKVKTIIIDTGKIDKPKHLPGKTVPSSELSGLSVSYVPCWQ